MALARWRAGPQLRNRHDSAQRAACRVTWSHAGHSGARKLAGHGWARSKPIRNSWNRCSPLTRPQTWW